MPTGCFAAKWTRPKGITDVGPSYAKMAVVCRAMAGRCTCLGYCGLCDKTGHLTLGNSVALDDFLPLPRSKHLARLGTTRVPPLYRCSNLSVARSNGGFSGNLSVAATLALRA